MKEKKGGGSVGKAAAMGLGGRSVASDYPGGSEESCCNKCITRVPYATLIALILNWAGVGVFCGTLYRLTNVAKSTHSFA